MFYLTENSSLFMWICWFYCHI